LNGVIYDKDNNIVDSKTGVWFNKSRSFIKKYKISGGTCTSMAFRVMKIALEVLNKFKIQNWMLSIMNGIINKTVHGNKNTRII